MEEKETDWRAGIGPGSFGLDWLIQFHIYSQKLSIQHPENMGSPKKNTQKNTQKNTTKQISSIDNMTREDPVNQLVTGTAG